MKTKSTVSDNPGEKMTLYGIAEKVLREREGQGLRSGEIVDAARKQGLIDNARGNVAHSLYGAIHAKIKRDRERCKAPAFSINRGLISLASSNSEGTVGAVQRSANAKKKTIPRDFSASDTKTIDIEKKLSFPDIAKKILREKGGQGMGSKEIVEEVYRQKLISEVRESTPRSLYSSIYVKIKNDQESGRTPVFSIERGLISLVSGKLKGVVEECRQEARKKIRDALRKIPASEFEFFIASVVLPCLNFEETSTTQATRDGGIDATGMLRTGTVQLFGTTKVKCFVQVKNWGKNKVSDKVVREVYGAAGEQSKASHLSLRMIFSMSDYTAKAREAAENLGVCLYTGDDIIDILIKNERGVKNENVPVPDYDYFKGGWKEQDN